MHSNALWIGTCCVAVLVFASPQATCQQALSTEQLREEAMTAFEDEHWELAHRRMAELLSLDGTDVFLQMRYAATLLHDARMRDEGIQRLASLADAGDLSGEGWLWWGKAWMLQGEPQLAESALLKALDEASKKDAWLEDCEHALAQARSLPTTFESRQSLQQLDAISVPEASFFRYVQWSREGVRLMLAPEEVMSKFDKKANVASPVTFWRGERELFFHSLGQKGSQGLDLHMATLDNDGAFAQTSPLPSHVNSAWDDIHPVWDPSSECLTFASNRPGTVGGFDLFQTCRQQGVWTWPASLGPMFNSVHDDLAYYPAQGEGAGWLVTGREASYGGVEVWEVKLDGEPQIPVHLNTQWRVDGEVIPGTMRLSDARTAELLAEIELNEERGQWNLVVGGGRVLRYSFETINGDVIEGTYAVPEANAPSAVVQAMVMTVEEGAAVLEARPLTQEATPSPDLEWGWGVVLDAVHDLEMEAWIPDDAVVKAEIPPEKEYVKKIQQFQTYPWWTEVEKEERAIAASVLSQYVGGDQAPLPQAHEYQELSAYQRALDDTQEAWMEEAVSAVMALAAKDVILNETPWLEALEVVLRRASTKWPPGTLSVEEVGRRAKRAWARSGVLYHQNVLPEVRDKLGLVGDGAWVEAPWQNERMENLAKAWVGMQRLDPQAIRLAWVMGQRPELKMEWEDKWFDPMMWDSKGVRDALSRESQTAEQTNLASIRTRLSILEMLEVDAHWTEDDQLQAIRLWKGLAVSAADTDPLVSVNKASDGPSLDSDDLASDRASAAIHAEGSQWNTSLEEEWGSIWMQRPHLSYAGDVAREVGGDSDPEKGVSWQDELQLWLEERASKGSVMRPDVVIAEAAEAFQDGSVLEREEDAEAHARLKTQKSELLADLIEGSLDLSEAQTAWQVLEATWIVTKWLRHPDWTTRSPDQIEALLPAWPLTSEHKLEEMRVAWAKSVQEDALPGTLAMAETSKGTETSAQPAPGDRPEAQAQILNQVEKGQALGARGVHLGWFRRDPQLWSLPEGATLASESGSNGLTRWVLVLPDNATKVEVNDIESWLKRQGVLDAYEVFLGSGGWTTSNLAPKPREALHVVTGDSLDTARQSLGEIRGQQAKASEGKTASETAADAESSDDWGTDDMWSHGAPVALGDLRGTWYAVQVGAFRGVPEKEWIEQAGERLIYEPFPDGLARWYAGVRQDRASSESKKEELLAFDAFADAFVVRLRNGVREVMRPGETEAEDVPLSPESPALTDVNEELERAEDPTALTGENQPGVTPGQTVPETQASPALVASSINTSPTVTMWHIDIAKYYGTVPSRDVATLLFKAADWGVRSVQLFGQTTYFTRSFNDLGEAERLLEGIQSEGFLNATLVEE